MALEIPPSTSPLTGAKPPVTPAAPPPEPPILAGPNQLQAKDAWVQLSKDVKANKLPASDARALAGQVGQIGVIGEAEALQGAHKLEALPADQQAQFQKLVDDAGSDTERAFLFKALASGHSLDEIGGFAKTIKGWDPEKLKHSLTLADDTGPLDGKQDGVKQQYADSCVPTTAQALRGEFDPIYSLDVRTHNSNIHDADDNNPTKDNPALAKEQKYLLENVGGGKATPRNKEGDGSWPDPAVNKMTSYTGYQYKAIYSPGLGPKNAAALCDGMATQLAKGIPTPISVTDSKRKGGHECLAVGVEGKGANQRFLIHDPWSGNTLWVSRTQFEQGKFDLAGWDRLDGYSRATAK